MITVVPTHRNHKNIAIFTDIITVMWYNVSMIPTYTISSKAIELVAKIAEIIGELQGSGEYARNLHLRKVNRLRSIQSSLAIENNSLSLDQVSDIVNGNRVLGKPSEIQEVKNAYQAYEHLLEYDPYSAGDFLKAHGYMTDGLVDNAGKFRSKGVGVFSGDQLIHAGAKADFVPNLIAELLEWANESWPHWTTMANFDSVRLE
jgi:Fic family protein